MNDATNKATGETFSNIELAMVMYGDTMYALTECSDKFFACLWRRIDRAMPQGWQEAKDARGGAREIMARFLVGHRALTGAIWVY